MLNKMCSQRSKPSNGSCNVCERYTCKAKQWPNYVKTKMKMTTLSRSTYPIHFKLICLFPHELTWCKSFHMSRLTKIPCQNFKMSTHSKCHSKSEQISPYPKEMKDQVMVVLLWMHPILGIYITISLQLLK